MELQFLTVLILSTDVT